MSVTCITFFREMLGTLELLPQNVELLNIYHLTINLAMMVSLEPLSRNG